MSVDIKKLVGVLKKKREAEGLSLRKLSAVIGVSFSTLARIERGDGEPDNNSLLRILDWLGNDGQEIGLTFENVAFVHFRAAKNVSSKTTKCLLSVASLLKNEFYEHNDFVEFNDEKANKDTEIQEKSLSLSKPEMEQMAQKLRTDLGINPSERLKALGLSIIGVQVYVPADIKNINSNLLKHLKGAGANEWFAMSVPLDAANIKWAILRNDAHSIERQRVTYLEECWHILLGHKLTKIARIGNAYGRTFESTEEHDAFYLASASLLPVGKVTELVSKRQSAAEIAKKFGTSLELVEYRIKRLGLWRIYKGMQISLAGE